MDKFKYYAKIWQEDDTYLVLFPDVEGAITEGATFAEAVFNAKDALAVMLQHYVEQGSGLPKISYLDGEFIELTSHIKLKLLLNEAFKASGFTQKKLAEQWGKKQPEVARLLDIHYGSKLGAMEDMFGQLGKRVLIEVKDQL